MVVSTGRDISKPMDQSSLAGYLLSILSKMRYQSAAVFWVRAGRLVVQEYFGYEEPFESLRVPANGQLGQVLLSVNNPVWRDQLTALVDPDLLENDERALMSLPRGHLWLPLANRGQLLGMIVLTPLHQEMWTSAEDLDILGTLATFGGVAADNVALVKQLEGQLAKVEYAREELAESQRRLLQGREDERLRLARELHDGPIQDLHAIRLRLGSANKNGGWLEYEEIQSSLIEIIHHLRDLCAHLRPPALETFGLSVALNSLADQARKTESTLTVGIKVADVCEQIPDHVKLALYRICQESLNNTLQHADARKVTIRIFCQENYIQLRVQDDGRGFEVPDRWVQLARHGHLGLLGIAERAESIGGRLDVYSANGRGTTVVVTAPFPCYEADDQVSINVLRSEGEYDSRSIGR